MPLGPSNTYQRLRLTITEQMRMSHIDQPLMLMLLPSRVHVHWQMPCWQKDPATPRYSVTDGMNPAEQILPGAAFQGFAIGPGDCGIGIAEQIGPTPDRGATVGFAGSCAEEIVLTGEFLIFRAGRNRQRNEGRETQSSRDQLMHFVHNPKTQHIGLSFYRRRLSPELPFFARTTGHGAKAKDRLGRPRLPRMPRLSPHPRPPDLS